jgi:hypothetical protein
MNSPEFTSVHRGRQDVNRWVAIVGRCREPDGWVPADALDVLSETSSATSAGLRRQTIPIPRTSLGGPSGLGAGFLA